MHDPVFAALTAQIAAVEQGLSRERILEIVTGSFRQLPVARRTHDLKICLKQDEMRSRSIRRIRTSSMH